MKHLSQSLILSMVLHSLWLQDFTVFMVRRLIYIMPVSKWILGMRYFSHKATSLPQIERIMGDRSMLVKGLRNLRSLELYVYALTKSLQSPYRGIALP
jgi:hypothetical protein